MVENVWNPFLTVDDQLYTQDTKDVAADSIKSTIRIIEDLGKSSYDEYIRLRLKERTDSM